MTISIKPIFKNKYSISGACLAVTHFCTLIILSIITQNGYMTQEYCVEYYEKYHIHFSIISVLEEPASSIAEELEPLVVEYQDHPFFLGLVSLILMIANSIIWGLGITLLIYIAVKFIIYFSREIS